MRVRVSLRAIWALHDLRHLLNPFKFGLFSFQLISHKLLRYMAFVPLVAVFLVNLLLVGESVFYVGAFVTQIAFYYLAWLGGKDDAKYSATIFTLPYYFTLLNVASAHAFLRYLKREKQAVWKPREG